MSDSATSSVSPQPANAPLSPAQKRQIFWLTIGAIAIYLIFRWMPTGTNLSHGDFRLEGDNVLEFCDPAAPQFLPVTTARSPVEFVVESTTARAGEPTTLSIRLATSTGKPIGPVDLLVAHTRKLHLMAVDPTLTDYLHVHPEPVPDAPGEWTVTLTPRHTGTYRLFADFTPAATARGLYASHDLVVPGEVTAADKVMPLALPAEAAEAYAFDLTFATETARAREPIDMTLRMSRRDGGEVELGEVMGAFAHLVAFDLERTGFAHLHPREIDLNTQLDPTTPELHFQVTIPNAGDYVIWAQMILNGTETFVPFRFAVAP